MTISTTLLTYTLVLLVAVLLGGNLTRFLSLTHTRMQLIMSFVSGLMLGVAIFHLLPHSLYSIGNENRIEVLSFWLMAGLLTMFLLLRLFHFHHHDLGDDAHDSQCVGGHDHSHSPGLKHEHKQVVHGGALGWVGIAIGLTLHTMIDGIALAAAVQADFSLMSGGSAIAGLLGFGVFLAILLHKPLDALTITTLMERAGASLASRTSAIVVFALICPVSAGFVLWGLDLHTQPSAYFPGAALAFSAGVFLCISLSDLLPEVHFHSHDRFKMTAALLLGVSLSWLIHLVEADHLHEADQGHSVAVQVEAASLDNCLDNCLDNYLDNYLDNKSVDIEFGSPYRKYLVNTGA